MGFEKYPFRSDDTGQAVPGLRGAVYPDEATARAAFRPLFSQAQQPQAGPQSQALDEAERQAIYDRAYNEGFTVGMHQGADEGYARGLSDGQKAALTTHEAALKEAVAQAVNAHEKAMEAALGALNLQIMQAYQEACEQSDKQSHHVATLARSIAQKLAGKALQHSALDMLQDQIGQLMTRLGNEPSLVIEVAEPLVALMEPLTERMKQESGFRGTITWQPRPDLPLGDCHVRWQHGQAWRSNERLQHEIDAMLNHLLMEDDGATPHHPLPSPHTPPSHES
jgi:flagellar biosynthesis/type III secretory pathway protein FliH